jgi:hypothetical protein
MNAEQLAILAREIEVADPIDWGMLPVQEEKAYLEMAKQVLDIMRHYNPADRQTVALASVVKLLVENFVLNIKLMDKSTR